MRLNNWINQFKDSKLIGKVAHKTMAAVVHDRYFEPDSKASKAAVLILLYPKDNQWYIAYIQRASNRENDKHAGQISFPGGSFEKGDLNLQYCAIRETQEEIGVEHTKLSIIKELSPIYVFVSQFMVYPFVAIMDELPIFKKQDTEVQSIIEVPLKILQNPNSKKSRDISIRNELLKNVPYFDIFGHVLWGATAMITEEFLQILAKIDDPNNQFLVPKV